MWQGPDGNLACRIEKPSLVLPPHLPRVEVSTAYLPEVAMEAMLEEGQEAGEGQEAVGVKSTYLT